MFILVVALIHPGNVIVSSGAVAFASCLSMYPALLLVPVALLHAQNKVWCAMPPSPAYMQSDGNDAHAREDG